MNELTTPLLSQLPTLPTEDIKQTVDKVGAYVDALAAAKKATTDQNTINEIDDQIRKYSAFKIRCQMELGERTAKMEKASHDRGNQYTGGKIPDGNIAKLRYFCSDTQYTISVNNHRKRFYRPKHLLERQMVCRIQRTNVIRNSIKFH